MDRKTLIDVVNQLPEGTTLLIAIMVTKDGKYQALTLPESFPTQNRTPTETFEVMGKIHNCMECALSDYASKQFSLRTSNLSAPAAKKLIRGASAEMNTRHTFEGSITIDRKG